LDELAFGLKSGEVAALIGPSGCGKTTLLRIIAGLDRDFEGRVTFPSHGRLGVVFQEPRLLAWRTVEQNVRLVAPHASDADLAALFEMLELPVHRNHYPGELSLGLARRVALARAFAVNPDLLLLDEPFVSLDAELALRLRDQLAQLVNRRSPMTLLVSHNLDEAIGLADRLLFLSASPARVLAEIPVASPRGAHNPEKIAALRAEIARPLNPPASNDRSRIQYVTTLLMLLPSCIRSNPLLISPSGMMCVIMGSISILPSMYQSTILGTSVRPRAPPNAVPFHTRPVTSWKGRVAISAPAGATPMMMDCPQPRWQASNA
jgi:ABC-type nitrate/sulfonate/bicarbonate transport system ATPase subunit